MTCATVKEQKMDTTLRFSNRVDNYVKYRPTYPAEVLGTLKANCQFTHDSHIADIGSGTGILTRLFLQNGNSVFGVEPNREMREAGERLLRDFPHFQSVNGTAEATTLPDQSVDFVTAGQAFHWFNRARAKAEFLRILRPQGWVMFVWNDRQISTPFLQDYEQLLRTYATDYEVVNHQEIDNQAFEDFFAPHGYRTKAFNNHQNFDFEGLKGRLLSSSYAPESGHPNHEPMLEELEKIFRAYHIGGKVDFLYLTTMYYGRL